MAAEYLEELRRLMRQKGDLEAYVVLTDDAHQSEYIADCDKRREFISGFTGSAGVAIVTQSGAFLWTDGRYHLQASLQLDPTLWTLMKQGNEGVLAPEEWLGENISNGDKIGYDPRTMAHCIFKKYSEAVKGGRGGVMTAVLDNLVDIVWADKRPPPPKSDIIILESKYAGRSWQKKVQDVRKELVAKNSSALLVTALDEVAWLFNLRGSDIDYNPVFFGYALVTMTDIRLYVWEERTSLPHLREFLTGVKLLPYAQVLTDLQELVQELVDSKVWVSDFSSQIFVEAASSHRCSLMSPLQLFKAVKNETEISGMRQCHVRDSAALCEYLCWLEEEVPKGRLNEVTAANKLDGLRQALPNYVSLSFPTISSSGPNGAIIHYQPNAKTARALSTDEIYLCDSGGQYLDGTTDVTRTVSFGNPSSREKEAFTLVLKGHIALSSAIFPDKTLGNQLDCLARASLWQRGLDYKHGTGHGVGAFLNVHEGPHGISKTRSYSKPMQAGMFVTDEPGYYEDGSFGVRIENVELVKHTDTQYKFGDVDYLTMEPVTLVPIQKKMIDTSLLTQTELAWLNSYHAECNKTVGQYLLDNSKSNVADWLTRETLPLVIS